MDFYISAWSDNEKGGIYHCTLSETGAPEVLGFVPLRHAGYLAFSPDKKFLYSTCMVSESSDGVAGYTISADGSLAPAGVPAESSGKSCCHLTVALAGNFLYAANYFTGNFAEYPLDDHGYLKPPKIFAHCGKGPNTQRQDGPHCHCCQFTPDGKYLCVIDLGIDSIAIYPYDPAIGIDAQSVRYFKLAPGCGPRHITFDYSGKIAYVVTELGNSVISLGYEAGEFTVWDELSLLPRGVGDTPTKASAVRLSPNGGFLALGNRGFDSIAIVELDNCGGLFPASLTLSGGSSPRDMNYLSPNYFAVANEFSDEVRFFDFDSATGNLTPNGFRLSMPRPLCIIER